MYPSLRRDRHLECPVTGTVHGYQIFTVTQGIEIPLSGIDAFLSGLKLHTIGYPRYRELFTGMSRLYLRLEITCGREKEIVPFGTGVGISARRIPDVFEHGGHTVAFWSDVVYTRQEVHREIGPPIQRRV